MNRDSNAYTFIFATLMVLVVASVLAFTASSLKDLQDANVRKEKMQNILATIGIETDREQAETLYNQYIVEELSLVSGGEIDTDSNAFELELSNELKKPLAEQHFPLYVANVDGVKSYVVPLRGAGLWNAIWGYIALKEDKNTIQGAVFDHVGEKVFDTDGNLVGINVSKTNNDPKDLDKEDHEVDAISGATITGDGVTDMIKERLQHYLPYLKSADVSLASNQ